METNINWTSIYSAVWILGLIFFPWISIWYLSSSERRSKDIFAITLKQFVMHANLTPNEITHRLTGAVEPFTFLRNPFTLNTEAYEGQWLTADRFELHRVIPRNVWYAYGEIFPYPQNTTLVKVTLKTSALWLAPLIIFFFNPILLGILASAVPAGREINILDILVAIPLTLIFCGLPGAFLLIAGGAMYAFTFSRESGKVRVFLERLFAAQ